MALDFFEEEDQQEESFLLGGEEAARYFRPTWINGDQLNYAEVSQDMGDPKGFHFHTGNMPEAMLKAFKKLEKAGRVRLVTLIHGDQTEKDYYRFVDATPVYVMSHGAPSKYADFSDPKNQYGIVIGQWTKYITDDKKKALGEKPKIQTGSFLSAVGVFKELADAGYLNEDGQPIPVSLYFKGEFSDDASRVFLHHLDFIRTMDTQLREMKAKGGKEAEKAGERLKTLQYWAYAQMLQPTKSKVPHKGPNKTKKWVYTLTSTLPEKKDWTLDLLDSLCCGEDAFNIMQWLVWDETASRAAKRRIMGGPVIDWCKQEIANMYENMKVFMPPDGKSLKYGTIEEPTWLATKAAREEAQIFNPNAVQESGAPVRRTPSQMDEDELRNALNLMLRKFKTAEGADESKRNEGLELTQTGIDALNKGHDRAMAQHMLEEAGKIYRDLDVPF